MIHKNSNPNEREQKHQLRMRNVSSTRDVIHKNNCKKNFLLILAKDASQSLKHQNILYYSEI